MTHSNDRATETGFDGVVAFFIQVFTGGRRVMRMGLTRSGLARAAAWIFVLVLACALVGFTILGRGGTEILDYLLRLAGFTFAGVGALILARTSGNRIGWVMAVSGLFVLGSGLLTELADSSVNEDIRLIATAIGGGTFFSLFFLFGLLLFWFPTGQAVSHRWRWLLWVGVGGCILAVTYVFSEDLCVEEGGGEGCTGWARNPIGIRGIPNPEYGRSSELLFGLLAAFALFSAISLIVRYVRSRGIEKLQIKWLAFAVASVLALIILWQILDDWIFLPWSEVFFGLSILSIPVAVGISVMRYRLYDIDRIISRTVAYALVVATLTIAYLAVVLGVGAIATAVSPSDVDLPIPVLATALVAIGFQPVRRRALGVANRLVFGRRRTPYEALAGIEGVDLDDLLPDIARLVTESTAADRAIIWLSNGFELQPAAVFPDDTAAPEPIPLVAGQISPSVDDTTYPLIHHGSLIGAITTVMGPGEDLPADDKRLLKDLAAHAATTVKGALDATPLPEGIVTFLMTDIEGSTRLWEDDPQRMAEALRQHDELTRRIIGEGGGILVKWKGEGDSTFSVFTDPNEAVDTAMALQGALQGHQWDVVRPISIRAALHTGEAELRERDYFGQTVNRCARLRSLARGGQTLVSAATRELVRSGSSETLTFKDLGEHQLRDVSEPERIYEVIAQTQAQQTVTPETEPVGI